jgi:hypothetical protein
MQTLAEAVYQEPFSFWLAGFLPLIYPPSIILLTFGEYALGRSELIILGANLGAK